MEAIIQTILGCVITPQELVRRVSVEVFLVFVAICNAWLVSRKVGKERRRGRLQFTSLRWWTEMFKTVYKRVISGKTELILKNYTDDVLPELKSKSLAQDIENTVEGLMIRKREKNMRL